MGFAGWLTSFLNLLGMGGGGSGTPTSGGKVCGTVGVAPRVAGAVAVGVGAGVGGSLAVSARVTGTVGIEEC